MEKMMALKILEEWELGHYTISFHSVFITLAFPITWYVAITQD